MHSTVIRDAQQGGSSIVCLTDRNYLQACSTDRLNYHWGEGGGEDKMAASCMEGTSSSSSNNAFNLFSSCNQVV